MNNYFLRIYIREREREFLEELGRGDYQAPIGGTSSGLSKKIACGVRSALSRLKKIASRKQSLQQAIDLTERYEPSTSGSFSTDPRVSSFTTPSDDTARRFIQRSKKSLPCHTGSHPLLQR